MAISLADLRLVKADLPPRIIIYGVHGIGKTTLAAEAPNPVFLQIEEGTPGDLELMSFGELASFRDVMEAFGVLYEAEHDRESIVIDTVDALEPLVWREVCARNNWQSIEEPGYGKGYVAAEAVWQEYLDGINALRRQRGMTVIQVAHADIERFDSPISEPYHRYHMKLHKRASALLQQDADVVCFMNYITTIKQADVGFNKKTTRGEGAGQRAMYFEERPGFLAKNRFNMPAQMLYRRGQGWTDMAGYFPANTKSEPQAA